MAEEELGVVHVRYVNAKNPRSGLQPDDAVLIDPPMVVFDEVFEGLLEYNGWRLPSRSVVSSMEVPKVCVIITSNRVAASDTSHVLSYRRTLGGRLRGVSSLGSEAPSCWLAGRDILRDTTVWIAFNEKTEAFSGGACTFRNIPHTEPDDQGLEGIFNDHSQRVRLSQLRESKLIR